MLKECAVVSVVKLHRPPDDYNDWGVNQRPPEIGDKGTIVEVLQSPDFPVRYLVQAEEKDGSIIWLCDLEPGEITLAPDHNKTIDHKCFHRYIRIQWNHDNPKEPTDFFLEVKEDDWLARGVEVFADGSTDRIGHGLNDGPIPPLDEINSIPEFIGQGISKDEFEIYWKKLQR